MNVEFGLLGGGEDFFGLGSVGGGGTFDLFEARLARHPKAIEHGCRLGQHAEFDGLANRQSPGRGGGKKWRGGKDLALELEASGYAQFEDAA